MEESKVKDLTAYKNRFEEDASSFSEFQARDFVKELKNQGKTDEAIEVGRTFLEMAPELKGYINYFGYALYNKYINIDDEEISIYLVNPKAPCFIKNEEESYIYLILPVNFNTAR